MNECTGNEMKQENGGFNMMKNIRKQLKNERGLTLVELLAVIVILAIIAAIAIPAIGNIITNSKVNALKADGQNVLSAAGMYFLEIDEETASIKDLVEEGFLEDTGGFDKDSEADKVTRVTDGDGNTLNGTAKNGNIEVIFNDATNADITNAGTKETEDTQKVEIIR